MERFNPIGNKPWTKAQHAKAHADAALEPQPGTLFIVSNRQDDLHLHIARRREARGSVTGKLFKVYYVAACNGRQLGGAWGQRSVDTIDHALSGHVCDACLRAEGSARK